MVLNGNISVLFGEGNESTRGKQTLSHKVVASIPRHEWDSNLVVRGTDCIGSCKSNYYAITTTTAHLKTEEST
jgi:ubiquinone biosynthesis protein COQ9